MLGAVEFAQSSPGADFGPGLYADIYAGGVSVMTTPMPHCFPPWRRAACRRPFVQVGDKVEPGQVIAEIETDKATMEVEAVDDGEISEILVPAGTEGVKVNTPIARLKGGDAGIEAAPAAGHREELEAGSRFGLVATS